MASDSSNELHSRSIGPRVDRRSCIHYGRFQRALERSNHERKTYEVAAWRITSTLDWWMTREYRINQQIATHSKNGVRGMKYEIWVNRICPTGDWAIKRSSFQCGREAIDGLPQVTCRKLFQIYSQPLELKDLSTSTEILHRSKVIDYDEPMQKGCKSDCSVAV